MQKKNKAIKILKQFIKIKIAVFCLTFILVLTQHFLPIYASNYLTNPSFTGNTNGWTLSNATYDADHYEDSAGSVRTQAIGRNTAVLGTATQTISTTIDENDVMLLSLYWSKQCQAVACGYNNIRVEVAPTDAEWDWRTLWENTSTPAASNEPTDWAHVDEIDVSEHFDETTTYLFRLTMDIRAGNNANAAAYAWFDNIILESADTTLEIDSVGSQKAVFPSCAHNMHIGGAFSFKTDIGAANVTEISITNTGTIPYDALGSVYLYYKEETTCSSTIPVDANEFNTTPGDFNSSNLATITGTMNITTDQTCVYVSLSTLEDYAHEDETINIRIANPTTDITTDAEHITPSEAVIITGATFIKTYYGDNYLNNGSFTGNANGWTLSNAAYDADYYNDTAGSLRIRQTGRNNNLTGTATQTITMELDSESEIDLSFYWSKQCLNVTCRDNDMFIEIAKQSAPTTWTTLWQNTSIPTASVYPTRWQYVHALPISQYIDETTTYIIRLRAYVNTGSHAEAQATAWFDHLHVHERNPGYLMARIVDEVGELIVDPVIKLPKGLYSDSPHQVEFTFGDPEEQICITNTTENPIWSVSIAAAGGPTAKWESTTDSYKYNGTAAEGRLMLDSSDIEVVVMPLGDCTDTGFIIEEEPIYFEEGIVDEITIISTDETADTNCRWALRNINFLQDVPAEQSIGVYKLEIVLTIL